MFLVTEEAQKEVSRYFSGKKIKPVRIYVTDGCSGQRMAMAVDGLSREDAVFTFGELTFIIDRSLMDQAEPIRIDVDPRGFAIDVGMRLNLSCSGCGKSGTCKKQPGRTRINASVVTSSSLHISNSEVIRS